jgi:hypothetical protein
MKCTQNTEQQLVQDIQLVQTACAGNQILYLSHCFKDSPNQAALVVCYVTCPDALALALHAKLDTTAAEFFAIQGISRVPGAPHLASEM